MCDLSRSFKWVIRNKKKKRREKPNVPPRHCWAHLQIRPTSDWATAAWCAPRPHPDGRCKTHQNTRVFHTKDSKKNGNFSVLKNHENYQKLHEMTRNQKLVLDAAQNWQEKRDITDQYWSYVHVTSPSTIPAASGPLLASGWTMRDYHKWVMTYMCTTTCMPWIESI